eukprot:TRINITY_DN3095_c0_g1_i4.p1 TRINITY_DN3095_c0_g1~~TRINITY_DN3095_c0_g1_i4.p1  ORF type:complete len:177 (-),score=31.24 TRINITY_DN3095_c0_g1_i4:192-701(-)
MSSSLLQEKGIIPDVVDAFEASSSLSVEYPAGGVQDGNELTPDNTKEAPKIVLPDKDSLYTLAFIDPDAPSNADPKFRSWRHWLVCNIKDGDIASGDVSTPYIGPGPPAGSGFHRYCFVLYKQKAPIQPEPFNNEREGRRSFSIINFAAQHDLGHPLVLHFFLAKNAEQ